MPENLSDETLSTIYREFVLRGPASARYLALSHYGWRGPLFNKLSRRVSAALPHLDLIGVKSIREAQDQIAQQPDCAGDSKRQYIVFTNNKKNRFTSLLWHIRNAFAHGRVTVILRGSDPLLQIRDEHGGNANMFGCVRLSTLVTIRELIEAGPHAD